MSADLTKRIVVRVTDEQLAWIGQMSADEGMDNATFVRVVLDRLSKGRPPLIGMMQAPQMTGHYPVNADVRPFVYRATAVSADGTPSDDTSDIIAQRAAEAEASIPETVEIEDHQESAAIPLRRVPRQVYNPGRN